MGRYPQRRRSSLGGGGGGGGGGPPGMLSGVAFLVTGFADALDAKRRCVALIREHGGILLADLPPAPQVRPLRGGEKSKCKRIPSHTLRVPQDDDYLSTLL